MPRMLVACSLVHPRVLGSNPTIINQYGGLRTDSKFDHMPCPTFDIVNAINVLFVQIW